MIKGIHHFAVSVPDLEKAVDFYCNTLGYFKVFGDAVAEVPPNPLTDAVLNVKGVSMKQGFLVAEGINIYLELFEFSCGQEAKKQDPNRPVIDHGYTHFGFEVEDIFGEYERLKKAGMEFHSEPQPLAEHSFCVYGRDPFGNVIELQQADKRDVPYYYERLFGK